jgi:thymidylate synthase
VLNPAFAVAETVWILSGTDASWIYNYNERLRQYADDGVLRGAYGPRMRRWGGRVDQLYRVVEILKQDPDSRRAVIQLYDPALDAGGHRDVPCTLGYRFHIRHGRLHMSTSMRGQDVWIGLPYDLFATTVLHELVASWLGVDIGEYHHHVDSLHIYERDLDHVGTLPSASFSADMTALATPWNGFDELLSKVVDGASTGHRGWDAMAATMFSYRQWKNGDDAEALRTAAAVDGRLGEALDTWYERLSARRAATTTGSR